MAAAGARMPDKGGILSLVETVLARDLGMRVPDTAASLDMVEPLGAYGQVLVGDLGARRWQLATEADVRSRAEATLGEASQRLAEPPPRHMAVAAAQRAQSLARLVQALLSATAAAVSPPPAEEGCRG
ncbi:DUF6415 family natural product biosynthesis protein [Streptomyces sp. NPDC002004]